MIRIGIGYDSHRFDPGRPLVLGGITVPDHPGLAGHSDGDAIAHAVIDAVLGAASAGDVGSHFPPSDDAWADADSIDLLHRAVRILRQGGWGVVNVDVVVVCETPKISSYRADMITRLAEAVEVPAGRISIKGKTNESMGWIGRGEGLAVHAVALIERSLGGDPPT